MQWNFITRWALGCINFLRQVHKKQTKFLSPRTLSLGTHSKKGEQFSSKINCEDVMDFKDIAFLCYFVFKAYGDRPLCS